MGNTVFFSDKKLMERLYLLGPFQLSMIFQDLENMVFCAVHRHWNQPVNWSKVIINLKNIYAVMDCLVSLDHIYLRCFGGTFISVRYVSQ